MKQKQVALLAWESRHSVAVGGLGEHITELASALDRRGHQVHVYTRRGEGQSGYDCVDGVHYHRCQYEPHPDFFVDNQRMCDSFVWHLAETESYLTRPFDVVHAHDWLAVKAMVAAKNRHGAPVVLTVHSTEFGRCGNQLFEGPSRRIREIEWEGTYVAERVLCVSGMLRNEVQGLYSVPGDKMHVVYNGIDVERFDARVNTRRARNNCAVGLDDPLVLFAGRMTQQKGPDLLMEAVPRLLRDHPDAKFVFAGDGDLRSGLERRAVDLGVDRSTRFLGHRNGRELVGLFKSADVVCVPSRNEPFGIVILEAWSARKPVVATRNGGPAEFVKHEDTGLTVSDDQEAIGWGLGTVLADRPYGRRMGRNGRKEAEARFSWDTVAAQTEEVYQTVWNRRSTLCRQSSMRIEEVTGMARPKSTNEDGATAKGNQAKGTTGTIRTAAKPAATMRATKGTTETVTKSMAASAVSGMSMPSVEDIRKRAYEIYLGRGSVPGDPVQDWLQAERELEAEQAKTARRRVRSR